MTGTLIERLPARIARLQEKRGPNDPFVRDLKEQLRASRATQGRTAEQVFKLQATQLGSAVARPTAQLQSPQVQVTEGKKAKSPSSKAPWTPAVNAPEIKLPE